MNFELSVVFSLSIVIATVAGLARWKKTDPIFLPFLILVIASLANEIISFFIVRAGYSNVILYNFFSLAEFALVLWQFRNWGLFNGGRTMVYFLMVGLLVLWITETILRGGLHQFNSYFIVLYSTCIVLMSINMMNKVMFHEPSQLFQNSIFLICMGFVFYFTYAILVEVFWFYGLNKSKTFRIKIYEILAYINLFTNIIFALAILWMPLKRQYIMRS